MLSQLIARVNLIQMIYLFNKFPGDAFHNGPFSRRSSAEVSRASSPTICLSTPKLPLPMLIPSTLQPTLRRSEAPAKRSRVCPGGPAAPRLLRPGGPPTLPRANVQSSVQPRGPGLGAENLHPPRSRAPPAGSLYASATTEKNRCWHLREDLPAEITAVTQLSLFLSFQVLSAVCRILSHWEWVRPTPATAPSPEARQPPPSSECVRTAALHEEEGDRHPHSLTLKETETCRSARRWPLRPALRHDPSALGPPRL